MTTTAPDGMIAPRLSPAGCLWPGDNLRANAVLRLAEKLLKSLGDNPSDANVFRVFTPSAPDQDVAMPGWVAA
jgi:hypothetical protein